MSIKRVITIVVLVIAIISSSAVLLATIFDLQYSILIGPFLDFLLLGAITIFSLILAIIAIPTYGVKRILSYLPLVIIILSFLLTFVLRNFNLGHSLHYKSNKRNLEIIEEVSSSANIYELSDMLRHSKSLNEAFVANDEKYRSAEEVSSAFGDYIKNHNLDLNKILEIQKMMIRSNIISLNRTDEYLVLTIDGFVDNEYGYVKSYKKDLKERDSIPPYGFIIVRLIELDNGWYFFYST